MHRNFAALIRTFYLSECTETLPELWRSLERFTSQNLQKLCPNFGTHLDFLPISMYRIFARTLTLIRTFYPSECTETLPELWHSFELFTHQNVPKLYPNFGTHSNFLPFRMYRNFGTHANFLHIRLSRNFARTLALSWTFTSQYVPNLCPNFDTHSNFLPIGMYRNFARTLALIRTFYLSECTETLPEFWHSFGLFTSQYVPNLCPNFDTHSNFLHIGMYRNFARTLALIRTFYLSECTETLILIWTFYLKIYRNFTRTLALSWTFTSQNVPKLCPNFGTNWTFYLSECTETFARTLAPIRTTETLHELWYSFELFTTQIVPKPFLNFGTHSVFLPLNMYRNFARTLALIRSFYLSKCTETFPELWPSFEFLPLRIYRNFARTLALIRTFYLS
jgi:hypothetical protein